MEINLEKLKWGICKNPINQENAKSRYVVTESRWLNSKLLSCKRVNSHTHRNILIKDMVLTDEQADYKDKVYEDLKKR
jgi:hypothetical protein